MMQAPVFVTGVQGGDEICSKQSSFTEQIVVERRQRLQHGSTTLWNEVDYFSRSEGADLFLPVEGSQRAGREVGRGSGWQ